MKKAGIKFLMVTLFMVGLTLSGTAQNRGNRGNVDQKIERMDQHLSLSEDQKVQLKELFTSTKAQRDELMTDKEGNREQLKALKQETNAKLKEILTTEQYAKLKESRQNRKKKH